MRLCSRNDSMAAMNQASYSVRQDHFARQAASRCRGPISHLGAEFGGAVPVAIEYDEDCLAGRLTTCDLDGAHHAKFACQLIAVLTNGRSNFHGPGTDLTKQAPQQDRQCLHFAVAFDDWLDLHSTQFIVARKRGLRP